jgi:FAD-linked sulfhydryl oxidase
MAAYYPEKPTDGQKEDARTFMSSLSRLFPCKWCAKDLQEYMKENPPKVDSRKDFSLWMCETHNHVNRELGKPEFDCALIEQRWSRMWKKAAHATAPGSGNK